MLWLLVVMVVVVVVMGMVVTAVEFSVTLRFFPIRDTCSPVCLAAHLYVWTFYEANTLALDIALNYFKSSIFNKFLLP